MGWPDATIEGARPLGKGQKAVGRAVTLNFMPQRPDLAADKPIGVNSPEYEAFELCGPKSMLVMSSVGPWESVGGDIKFLRLKQLNLGGLVTDGSVRDTDEILSYGFPTWSFSTTPKQGPAAMQPWECNGVISCGKVLVRPGDAVIGDQDGVVVVPASHAQQVYDIAHGREVIEEVIKTELIKNPGPPGRYYPFKPPIKPESPLGKLLTEKVRAGIHRNSFPWHPHPPAPSPPTHWALLGVCSCDHPHLDGLALLGPSLSIVFSGHQVLFYPRWFALRRVRHRWPPQHVLGASDHEGGVNLQRPPPPRKRITCKRRVHPPLDAPRRDTACTFVG